jgi:hypothetical protein
MKEKSRKTQRYTTSPICVHFLLQVQNRFQPIGNYLSVGCKSFRNVAYIITIFSQRLWFMLHPRNKGNIQGHAYPPTLIVSCATQYVHIWEGCCQVWTETRKDEKYIVAERERWKKVWENMEGEIWDKCSMDEGKHNRWEQGGSVENERKVKYDWKGLQAKGNCVSYGRFEASGLHYGSDWNLFSFFFFFRKYVTFETKPCPVVSSACKTKSCLPYVKKV